MSKMSIVLHEDCPTGFAAAAIGHITLMIAKKYVGHPDYIDWNENSFRKGSESSICEGI